MPPHWKQTILLCQIKSFLIVHHKTWKFYVLINRKLSDWMLSLLKPNLNSCLYILHTPEKFTSEFIFDLYVLGLHLIYIQMYFCMELFDNTSIVAMIRSIGSICEICLSLRGVLTKPREGWQLPLERTVRLKTGCILWTILQVCYSQEKKPLKNKNDI